MQKDDALNKAIGKRIKEMRIKRNMSQEVFAEKIGVCSGTHVSNIERGASGISISKLVTICKTLDVSPNYLLFGITSSDVETPLHYYLKPLTDEQSNCLLDIIKAYIKACGIEEMKD